MQQGNPSRRLIDRPSTHRSTLHLMKGLLFFSWTIIVLSFLFIVYRQVYSYFDQPEAILMLGGSSPDLERERFTAQFASQHPELPVWISSGGSSPRPYERSTRLVFSKVGVTPEHLHFDYQAQDTLTNFTTLIKELKDRNINSIYLVTSDYHMPRARLVGEIVFGSRGIYFRAISVPSHQSREPLGKTLRDTVRALFWVATGQTGRN